MLDTGGTGDIVKLLSRSVNTTRLVGVLIHLNIDTQICSEFNDWPSAEDFRLCFDVEILRSLSPALLPAKRGRIWCREKAWKGLKASRLGRLVKRAGNPIPRNQKRSVASISFHLGSFQRNSDANEYRMHMNGMNTRMQMG